MSKLSLLQTVAGFQAEKVQAVEQGYTSNQVHHQREVQPGCGYECKRDRRHFLV
jgi:hypothetical protein